MASQYRWATVGCGRKSKEIKKKISLSFFIHRSRGAVPEFSLGCVVGGVLDILRLFNL